MTLRWFDGTTWTELYAPTSQPLYQAPPAMVVGAPRPYVVVAGGRRPHGAIYWLLIGWWLNPTMWAFRVLLWVVFWPVGVWRSIVAGRKRRERSAYRRARKG